MSDVKTWAVGGDLGDAVVSMQIIHAVGGRNIVRFVDREKTKIVDRVKIIKSLFDSQPYIEQSEISEEECDIDLTGFRRWHSSATYLGDAQNCEYNHQTGENLLLTYEPWIKVDPDTSFNGKVIIARSERYNNRRFDPVWNAAMELYGDRLVFVGLPKEHLDFTLKFGRVKHLRVGDFFELARAMSGCSLVIANQSSPHAVAMAVGATIVQETCDWQPDVILPRKNVQYVCDGECNLPDINGSGAVHIPPVQDYNESFNRCVCPPGSWQYPGLPSSTHFSVQCDLVAKIEKCTPAEAETKLFRHNVARVPGFFAGTGTGNDPLDLYRAALKNAWGVKLAPRTVLS